MRVVSLAPSLTEIVCAIGGEDLLVGRTTACDYPPHIVDRVPAVGGFGRPSMELLLTASPTLVLDVDLEDESVGQKIQNLGLRRERIACRHLDDIPEAIRTIGALIGRKRQAAALADPIAATILRLRKQGAGAHRPRVYVEIWHDPMMTAGAGSFVSELVTLAGGYNVGDKAEKDYFKVSSEWIVAADPEVVVCLFGSDIARPRDLVLQRAGWNGVTAVKRGAVYDDMNHDLILRPGPRVLESIEILRERIGGTLAGTEPGRDAPLQEDTR